MDLEGLEERRRAIAADSAALTEDAEALGDGEAAAAALAAEAAEAEAEAAGEDVASDPVLNVLARTDTVRAGVDADGDGRVSRREQAFSDSVGAPLVGGGGDGDGKRDDEKEAVRRAQRLSYPDGFDPDAAAGFRAAEKLVWEAGGEAAAEAALALARDGGVAAATALLMAASQAGEVPTIEALAGLGDGARPDAEARNGRGQTAVVMAAEFGRWPAVRALHERFGADIEAYDEAFHTPLSYAMRRPAGLAVVLALGARISPKYYAAALGEALDGNDFEVAAFLVGYDHRSMSVRPFYRRLFRLAKGYRQERSFSSRAFFAAVRDGWRHNPRPMAGALKIAGLLRGMAHSGDAAERHMLLSDADWFESRAVWLLEQVRSDVQFSHMLEFRATVGSDGTPLDLALRHDCFQFATHPRVTKVVQGWWRPFPLTVASLLQSPGELFRTPMVKFALDGAAYILFLALFVAMVIDRRGGNVNDDVSFNEQILFFIGVSFIANELTQVWVAGLGSYLSSGWGIADSIISVNVVIIAACRTTEWPDSRVDTVTAVYIASVIVSTLAFTVRSFFLFTDIPALGPLLISLGRMVFDLVNFGVLSLVFLAGFLLCFDFVIHDSPDPPEGYENTGRIMLTLFQGGLSGEPSLDFQSLDDTRRVFAEILSSLHLVVNGVVFTSLLIALLSATFEATRASAVAEFLFQRLRNRWDYDQSLNDLPPPFNLVAAAIFVAAWPFLRLVKCCLRDTSYDGGATAGPGGGVPGSSSFGARRQSTIRRTGTGGVGGGAVLGGGDDEDARVRGGRRARDTRNEAIELRRLSTDEVVRQRRNYSPPHCFYCHRRFDYGHAPPPTASWTAMERFPQLGTFEYRQKRYELGEHRLVNRLYRSGAACSCVRLRKLVKGNRYMYERVSVVVFTVLLWVPVVAVVFMAVAVRGFFSALGSLCSGTDAEDEEDARTVVLLGRHLGHAPGSVESQLNPFRGVVVPDDATTKFVRAVDHERLDEQ